MPETPAMIDCATAMRQLFDYLDDELTPAREAEVRQHLAVCAQCYPHFAFEQTFLAALATARSDRDQPPPERVRTRVVAALREAGFAPG
jgi:anti-sigma factor (TIGR02949 family)